MKRLNIVGLDTPLGYKVLELWHGDITKLGCPVDLLVVSAFRSGYQPVPGTVLGALSLNLDVSVASLAAKPHYDFREVLGTWVSQPVPGCEFSRLVCTELVGRTHSLADSLQSLFATICVLEVKGLRVESLAMPVLGAGNQGLPAASVISELISRARDHVSRSPGTRRIMFVEYDEERANALSDAMDRHLKRAHVSIPKTQLIAGVRADLTRILNENDDVLSPEDRRLVGELRVVLQRDDARSFELGVLARKMAERITDSLHQESTKTDKLDAKIRALGEKGVAVWIQQYLHVLRVVGNEAAHEKAGDGRVPQFIDESDVVISLLCMKTVVEFWLERLRLVRHTTVAG